MLGTSNTEITIHLKAVAQWCLCVYIKISKMVGEYHNAMSTMQAPFVQASVSPASLKGAELHSCHLWHLHRHSLNPCMRTVLACLVENRTGVQNAWEILFYETNQARESDVDNCLEIQFSPLILRLISFDESKLGGIKPQHFSSHPAGSQVWWMPLMKCFVTRSGIA